MRRILVSVETLAALDAARLTAGGLSHDEIIARTLGTLAHLLITGRISMLEMAAAAAAAHELASGERACPPAEFCHLERDD